MGLNKIDQEFINACKEGDIKRVKSFLSDGANINAKEDDEEKFEYTGLICAIWNGNLALVNFLARQKGIDLNYRDKTGLTALATLHESQDYLLKNKICEGSEIEEIHDILQRYGAIE